jgi:iron complex outermembrane receptor protein
LPIHSARVALIVFVGVTGMAYAQTTGPTASNGAAPAADEGGAVEIIVTAQRRAERLQDVPISITALSGKQLENTGIVDSQQLSEVTPGLNFSNRGGFAQPFIRGIGTESVSNGDESSVAVYVDGVYISQMTAQMFDFSNIQSVEVLKGPQGTLFGRNATGGAINITTRKPSFDSTYEASASWGSYNDRLVTVYASTGLSSKVALDVGATYHGRDSYITDTVDNRKLGEIENGGVRSKLLFEATDNLSVTFIGDYTSTDDPIGNMQRVLNRNSVAELQGVNTSSDRWSVTLGTTPIFTVKQGGGSAEVDYSALPFDLVSISAYRFSTSRILTNNSMTPLPLGFINNTAKSTDVTQEVRLVSKDSKSFRWVAGAFFYDDNSEWDPLLSKKSEAGPAVATFNSSQRTHAYAGFVDGTLDLTSQLALTAGVRYSHEHRDMIITLNDVHTPGEGNKSWVSFTPRGVLTYKPTTDVMLYASYTQGFKSGVFNTTATVATAPVNPATVDAYEVGAKTKVSGFLTLDASVFDYQYRNLQVSAQTLGTSFVTLQNAAQAKIRGADADATFSLARDFTVKIGAEYLDATYTSFPAANVFIPIAPPLGFAGAGNLSTFRNVSGNQIDRSPRWTINVSPEYTIPVSGDHELVLSANAYFNSGFYWDPLNRIRTKEYVMVNAQAEYHLSRRFAVSVFGRNLGNAEVLSTVVENALGDRGNYLEPRIVGAKVDYKF